MCLINCITKSKFTKKPVQNYRDLYFYVSYRYKVSYKKETGECKLEISMTFADDAGEYTIVVRNKLGEASATVSLLEEGTF